MTFTVAGIKLETVGLILMIVGVVALVASLLQQLTERRRHDSGWRDDVPISPRREH